MREYLMEATSPGLSPRQLRDRIQNDRGREMRYRRAIVSVSLIGMASMAAVTLFQTGIIKRLPDPPVRRPRFDTERVNSSKEAYSYGMPDGPLALGMHAANLAMAAAGPPQRYEDRPWLPVLATVSSGAQAAVAAKYLFHQMPYVDKAWCPYCVVDALTHFATFALTLPETTRVISGRKEQRG
ncbi:vitamin K epoxide reductase family protein [Microvirga roseola]|uniref:vitamin K epoxide reductase family protein n=1 Tax=Microvirga roseola TaxID=2883126 RepID=UPI001E33F96A|nr:vitamin K epoxide reductase family protein [Microvirga roseola]